MSFLSLSMEATKEAKVQDTDDAKGEENTEKTHQPSNSRLFSRC